MSTERINLLVLAWPWSRKLYPTGASWRHKPHRNVERSLHPSETAWHPPSPSEQCGSTDVHTDGQTIKTQYNRVRMIFVSNISWKGLFIQKSKFHHHLLTMSTLNRNTKGQFTPTDADQQTLHRVLSDQSVAVNRHVTYCNPVIVHVGQLLSVVWICV